MTLIEENIKTVINFTNPEDIKIGEMFIIDNTVFMKVRNKTNTISYVDLSSGEEYYEYEVMQNFKGWKEAQKAEGEMKWRRV